MHVSTVTKSTCLKMKEIDKQVYIAKSAQEIQILDLFCYNLDILCKQTTWVCNFLKISKKPLSAPVRDITAIKYIQNLPRTP